MDKMLVLDAMYTQPPNLPDLNILDLGLFNAIQAAYHRCAPRNQVQLIEMVERTYNEFPISTINRVWLSLMCCFNEILEQHGNNDYKVPHMSKSWLERLNQLPTVINISDDALTMVHKNSDFHVGWLTHLATHEAVLLFQRLVGTDHFDGIP
jgi:hypothetical protein